MLLRFGTRVTLLALFSSLACATACRNPTRAQPDLVIQTDSAAFHLGSIGGASVGFTVKNVSDVAVRLATCDGILFPTLEAITPDGIVPVETGGCDPPWTPLVLPPGEVLQRGAPARGVGRWRLRVPLLTTTGAIRRSTAVSNEFLVY